MMQKENVHFYKANDILMEAWNPLETGRILGNETLKEIAAHYRVSIAQLCIR